MGVNRAVSACLGRFDQWYETVPSSEPNDKTVAVTRYSSTFNELLLLIASPARKVIGPDTIGTD